MQTEKFDLNKKHLKCEANRGFNQFITANILLELNLVALTPTIDTVQPADPRQIANIKAMPENDPVLNA